MHTTKFLQLCPPLIILIIFQIFCIPIIHSSSPSSPVVSSENPKTSSRILFFTPLGTKSHKNVFEPLVKELARRGHQITAISNVKSDFSQFGPNVTEIVPFGLKEFLDNFPDPFEQRKRGYLSSFWNFSFVFGACDQIYADPQFQHHMNQPYDLVIVNGFMQHCFAGYWYKMMQAHNTPFIYLVSMAPPNSILQRLGSYAPTSFVPNSFLPLPADMNFVQRTINTVLDWVFLLAGGYVFNAQYEQVYRKHLGQDIPGLDEIERNVSLVLSNSYASFPSPRPKLPDVIEVGGMHCEPAKPLPADLEQFVAGAEHGFIFFSMGSVVPSKTMPEHVRNIFVNVFSRLKQRVLWKWDEVEMKGLPDNVRIGKWLPQQDILGHKNIRAFITHGGLLSTQESMYHGVPLVGIPIFIDQDLNMKQAEAAGFAVTLEILEITEEKLENVIRRVLDEPEFTKRSKFLSRAFRDQLETPVQRAAFWAEYVIRHEGAHHLRSTARHLNWFVYHSMDVIGLLIAILLGLIVIVVGILKLILLLIKKAIALIVQKIQEPPVSKRPSVKKRPINFQKKNK